MGTSFNVFGDFRHTSEFCLGMNPGYTPIIFEEEVLWCVEGYTMLCLKIWNLLNVKNFEYNKMSRWHFLLNSPPVFVVINSAMPYQQDSVKCYVGRVCTEILDQHHVPMLPWPGISQNQPTTENLWYKFVRRVRYHAISGTAPHCTTPWRSGITLHKTFVKKLIGSMRRRC